MGRWVAILAKLIVRRHPWEDWFSGATVNRPKYLTLTKGVDFDCEPHNMGVQIRNRARTTGYKVSIDIRGDNLDIRIWRLRNAQTK